MPSFLPIPSFFRFSSMIGFLFFLFGLLVTLGMCGLAAWSDFKGFRIPNLVPAVIVLAFALAFGVTTLTGQQPLIFLKLSSHLSAAGVVLLITMAMFGMRVLGAGDSKFAASVALWAGIPGLPAFLVYMALAGGLLGAASLALRKWKPLKLPLTPLLVDTWPQKAQEGHNSVPYGVAIAIGALVAMVFQGYFSFGKWADMFTGP